MDATVTLKVTPREFDLLRAAVEIRAKQQGERAKDRSVDAPSRDSSRQEAMQLGLILDKLR